MVTHNIGIIHIYVYKYLIKNLQYFIKKLTIYLAGNIYGNNLMNTAALGMGQLLFLKRLRMYTPKVIFDKRGHIFVIYILKLWYY